MLRSLPWLLALIPLLLLDAGCCATNRLWLFVRDDPVHVENASITADSVLHLAVRYDFGSLWHVTAPLQHGVEFPHTEATRVALFDGALPPSAHRLTASPLPRGNDDVSVYISRYQGKDGTLEHRVWVTGQGYHAVVTLPGTVHWNSGLARLGLLLTPLAMAVDVVCAPIWIGWCVLTAGCHGPCPLPWCKAPLPGSTR